MKTVLRKFKIACVLEATDKVAREFRKGELVHTSGRNVENVCVHTSGKQYRAVPLAFFEN
jgi:hypothetical protein